jgi:broad specificity phosphatase PhoE
MIYAICSAPITYCLDNLTTYKSFDLVARGLRDAPLSHEAKNAVYQKRFFFDEARIRTILTAPQGQTHETGQLCITTGRISNAKIQTTPLLQNIRFSMSELISQRQFSTGEDPAVMKHARRMFITKVFDNQFSESRHALQERMDELIALAKQQPADVLCIGHAFFLKILENYCLDPDIFKKREAFITTFNPDRRPYEPLSGFTIAM